MSQPAITLRIDATGTAFGSTPTWTDYSASLATAGDGEPVQITWGSQDEMAEPQPSTCSFLLENPTGAWTPGNAAAPAKWDIGCPVNIRVTVGGTTYDRFTGYVDAIEPAWPGGSSSWSTVRVTCSDIAARLGPMKPLHSLVVHEMLADSPTYLYQLNEPSGSQSAADLTGNLSPATISNAKAGPYTLTFGSTIPLFDSTTGVSFGSFNSGTQASALSVPYTSFPASGGWTQEVWFVGPTSNPASNSPVIIMASDQALVVRSLMTLNAPDGRLMALNMDGNYLQEPLSTNSVCDGGLHHAVMALSADRKTTYLYLDGLLAASQTSAGALGSMSFVANLIGGQTIDPVNSGGTFPGTIALAAFYPSTLSAARVAAHYQAGIGTGSERSDQRYSRLAGYGGVTTSSLPTGSQPTNGRSVIQALAEVARTEGTKSFVTASGTLTFHARATRYHEAAGITLAATEVTPDLQIRRDRQGLANQVTITRSTGASQVLKDTGSQNLYGLFDAGTFEISPSTDDDAYQNASWRVATHKNPQTRLPSLLIDLISQPNTAAVQSVMAATISTKVQITNLPSQAPFGTFIGFVEGAVERIGGQQWSVDFFTSPLTLEDNTLILDDATYGTTDSTNVLAF